LVNVVSFSSRSLTGGAIAGVFLLLGGIIFLGWNEGNFVKTQKDIEDTRQNTVKVGCDLSGGTLDK
jgi:hypothetical protein